ncbi:MAG: transposase [Pseudomonadota bacterium]
MSRCPTAGHPVPWAGLCPRSDERAGQRRSTRVPKRGTWIKTTLVTAAWAAVRPDHLPARPVLAHQGKAWRRERRPSSPLHSICCPTAAGAPTWAPGTSTASTSPRPSAACSSAFKASVVMS